jgi:aconitate hydratase
MAGPWLRYRGHLDNISNNCLIGAINSFNMETNNVKNKLTGDYGEVPATARAYKAAGIPSIVVGDHNYGEGSSREHAAMEPRHMGCRAFIAKSYARIFEANLKKQGVLPLIFSNKDDFEKIQEKDRITIADLDKLSPGKSIVVTLDHEGGPIDKITVTHTLNEAEIQWFYYGSALNYVGSQK